MKRIFDWRVTRKLSLRGVAARLTELHGPTPGGGPAWSEGTIQGILANPKYTGRIVLGRRTNASDSRRKGEQRIRPAAPRVLDLGQRHQRPRGHH